MRKFDRAANRSVSSCDLVWAPHRLGHYPNPLPLYQTDTVYVYDKSSAAGMLLGAVTGTPTEADAREILKAVNADGDSNSAEAKLEEVRDLLVQLQDVFTTIGE